MCSLACVGPLFHPKNSPQSKSAWICYQCPDRKNMLRRRDYPDLVGTNSPEAVKLLWWVCLTERRGLYKLCRDRQWRCGGCGCGVGCVMAVMNVLLSSFHGHGCYWVCWEHYQCQITLNTACWDRYHCRKYSLWDACGTTRGAELRKRHDSCWWLWRSIHVHASKVNSWIGM